jgi:plasmid stabilization system protein ParE
VTIIVSPAAREDLKQAYQQIAQDKPEAADRMLARITEVIGVQGGEVRLRDGRQVHAWRAARSSDSVTDPNVART